MEGSEVKGASVEFEGELAKKGANFLDRWQDRYFVLTDEGTLSWYKDVGEYKDGNEPQGNLSVAQIIRINEKDEPGYFDLMTPGRSYQLHASSSGTYYDLWLEAIRRVTQQIGQPSQQSPSAPQFRKKYTVSEIDFKQQRKTDRTLVFDEMDGVTNMAALARWRYPPENITAITRAPTGANQHRFTLSVVHEYAFEAKSEAQLAEIEKAVQHIIQKAGVAAELQRNQSGNSTAGTTGGGYEEEPAAGEGFESRTEEEEDARETCDIGDKKLIEVDNKKQPTRITLEDFEVIRIIGKGGQGHVALVRHQSTKKLYAMKSCNVGNKLQSPEGLARVIAEKEVLQRITHPFLVHLHYAFHKGHKIYLCLDLCNGGELFVHLGRQPGKRFHPVVGGFYIGEVVAAIAYLHANDIIYRDMKPENVLVCDDGHLKLTDFGLAKMGVTAMYGGDGGDVTQSLVGTPEYLAPEILSRQSYGKACDWWTIGILMFELMVGRTPFIEQGINRAEMFRRIQTGTFKFPAQVPLPDEAQDLISQLLRSNPSERLGSQSADDIKAHPFFMQFLKVKFEDLEAKKVIPPWKPQCIDISSNVPGPISAKQDDTSAFTAGQEPLSEAEEARMARFTFVSEAVDDHGF